VIVTTEYDQPYIYFLWYGDYHPDSWINNGEFNKGFDNFIFQPVDWQKLKAKPETLLIGIPDIPSNEWEWTIDYPDGAPVFVAAETL
jgi:hypothetical protein